MATLYSPHVRWTLPAGLGHPPIEGIDAVCAFNRRVWTVTYRADCKVEVLDEVGDDLSSAVRIRYEAFSLSTQSDYDNEYTLFVRCDEDGIREVFESPDTVRLLDSLQGDPPGTNFGRFLRTRTSVDPADEDRPRAPKT
jgi:hypothetical protein